MTMMFLNAVVLAIREIRRNVLRSSLTALGIIIGVAAVIVMMGFLGGLTLSAVKRSLGAKDWGVMIEGHGGMLDRTDSICFAAPIFFHIVRFFHGG